MSFGVATAGLVTANFVTSKVIARFDMLPGVHRAFFLLGSVTILSAALFLRRSDGDNVSARPWLKRCQNSPEALKMSYHTCVYSAYWDPG